MHWAVKYLSIGYKDMNCSKFVEHVLRNEFQKDFIFPQSEGSIFNQSLQIKNQVPKFTIEAVDPKDGDLVLMHGLRRLCHVGMFVKINRERYVLHTEQRMKTAALHKFRDLPLFGYTIEGIYTWVK